MPSARAVARVDTSDPDITWDPERVAASLPTPEFPYPDQTKKSHARKQAPGHIPRPRNPFILFRTNFVRQQRIPNSVESDHRNISRIVGRLWNAMTEEQREPWKEMAVREREEHAKIHPGYRFTPGVPSGSRKKKAKRGDVDADELAYRAHKVESPQYVLDDDGYTPPRRPSSCPPGAHHVPQLHLDSLRPRDDLSRRPSKISTFYQSYDSPLHQAYPGLAAMQGPPFATGHVQPLAHAHGDLGYPQSQHYDGHGRFDHHVGPYIPQPGYNNGAVDQQYEDHPWSAYEHPHHPVSHSGLLRDDEHLPAVLRSPPIFTDPFSNSLGGLDHRYNHASSLVMQQIMRFEDPIVSPKSATFPFDIARKPSHFPGRVLPKPIPNAKQKRESTDFNGNPFSFDRPYRNSSKSLTSLYIDYSGGLSSRDSSGHSNGIGSTQEYAPDERAVPLLIRDTDANSPTDSSLSPHTLRDDSP